MKKFTKDIQKFINKKKLSHKDKKEINLIYYRYLDKVLKEFVDLDRFLWCQEHICKNIMWKYKYRITKDELAKQKIVEDILGYLPVDGVPAIDQESVWHMVNLMASETNIYLDGTGVKNLEPFYAAISFTHQKLLLDNFTCEQVQFYAKNITEESFRK